MGFIALQLLATFSEKVTEKIQLFKIPIIFSGRKTPFSVDQKVISSGSSVSEPSNINRQSRS